MKREEAVGLRRDATKWRAVYHGSLVEFLEVMQLAGLRRNQTYRILNTGGLAVIS